MVAAQVYGNDAAIAFAGSQGNLELNVYKPVIIANFLHSAGLLADVCHAFVEFCIRGLQIDARRIASHVDRSLMLVTAVAPHVGYDKAAQLAKLALERDISLREANRMLKFLPDEQFDALVRPETMTGPLRGPA